MRRRTTNLFVLAAAVLCPLGLGAQARTDSLAIWIPEEGEFQEIVFTDGAELIGRVIDDGNPVRFELVSGAIVEIQRRQITVLRRAEGQVQGGQLWRPDPSANRLFFGPTGSTIEAGKGYFAVFEVVFPALGFALTDHFSIAGGTLLINDLGSERPFWLIPKLQIVDQESFDFSVGALAISSLDDDFGSVGVLFGVGTFSGGQNAAFTLGAGWGWVDDDLASTPAILVAGESRVASNVKLMTENYWIPTGEGDHAVVFSAGPRFMGDRLSADIALSFWTGGSDFLVFPLVNFVWNW